MIRTFASRLILCCLASSGSWLPAAEPSRFGLFGTSVAPDADYLFQGEYVREAGPGFRGWGLQVVALGEGRFRAALLSGGLPGYGADQWLRVDLSGQKEGDILTLHSEDQATTATVMAGQTAVVSGTVAGDCTLRKVYRQSATLGATPPRCAIVLFDGTDTRAFANGQMNEQGWLKVGTDIIPKFRDFTMHLEFLLPYMPDKTSQGRGNSGLYVQSRYEVQILDSFGTAGEFNECGSLYRYRKPDINMCLPPLQWQTYDITFHSPRFDRCGRKRCHARVTLRHNGVVVQNNTVLTNKTGAGQAEGPEILPTKLQDHHDPVHFRNIWVIPHDRTYLRDLAVPLPYVVAQHQASPFSLPGMLGD